MAREMNEFGAKIVSDYKGRFGLFALLPLPDIEGSLKEIEYAFDTLKADGVGLVSSYGNAWLGDPSFRPVFDELNRRRTIVYKRIRSMRRAARHHARLNPPTIEYNTDTARTIFSLVQGTAPDSPATRNANINFIFSLAAGPCHRWFSVLGIGPADTIADVLARPAEPNSGCIICGGSSMTARSPRILFRCRS